MPFANDNSPDPAGPDGLSRLLAIMARLRDPDRGCPWDVAQDFDSIAPYTIEEAYEVADAIARRDWEGLRDELGDLLLQVVYHAQMAREAGRFGFDDAATAAADKMVARHPHVFGPDRNGGAARNTDDGTRGKSADQQSRDWEAAKAAERAGRDQTGALDGVALGLPALTRAAKLQKRAARVGFDWPDAAPVAAKLAEEAAELTAAERGAGRDDIAEEYGDLLFAAVNLGRHLDLDPEGCLRAATAKFARRFAAMEARLTATGRSPAEAGPEELDGLWEAVKDQERRGGA